MYTQTVNLIDPNQTIVATAQVFQQDKGYRGRIDLNLMPASLRQKFIEYEEIVNGQMFSLLDEIEDQIAALRLKIRFALGHEAAITDLQIYPTTGRISFALVKEPAYSPRKEPIPV